MKRFKFPFGFGGQDKVTFGQTLNLVRADLKFALPPKPDTDQGGGPQPPQSPNFVRKGLRLREVLEGIEPLQMPFPVYSPAVAEVLQQLPRSASL